MLPVMKGIPTNHTAGVKQLPEATPVCNVLGKGPIHRQFSGHEGGCEKRTAGPKLSCRVLGTGIKKAQQRPFQKPCKALEPMPVSIQL